MKEETIERRNARVILCKCPAKTKGGAAAKSFGIRIEERKGDWIRTWAFKIDEDKARRENFDKEKISGSLNRTAEYPGCPWCGTSNIAECSCGKLFCWTSENNVSVCPWCGKSGEYQTTEILQVQGGGF